MLYYALYQQGRQATTIKFNQNKEWGTKTKEWGNIQHEEKTTSGKQIWNRQENNLMTLYDENESQRISTFLHRQASWKSRTLFDSTWTLNRHKQWPKLTKTLGM